MAGLWVGVIGWAWGSPGSAGAVHLGALPLEQDQQWIGAGGVVLWDFYGPWGAGVPVVEAGTALGSRGAVSLQAGLTIPEAAAVPFLLSGRYLVVDQPGIRFAATLQYTGLPLDDSPFVSHLSPGIALDAGGEHVRFDLAVPLWGLSSYGPYVGVERDLEVPLVSTLGLNVLLGEHHRLRIGLPETVSWHYRAENVFVDLGGLPFVVAGGLWSKVGFVF